MRNLKLSLESARRMALRSQLLDSDSAVPSGLDGVVSTLDQLGYVQIDTIATVERSHHHTFWTRYSGYSKDQLHDLQTRDRRVFEYWGHTMSYLPISDYRFCLPRMRNFRNPRSAWLKGRLETCAHLFEPVLKRIRDEGPLGSKDFASPEDEKRGTWWDWKPAKHALEFLFWRGDLMVAERRNFQKLYDLTERVLPPGVDTTMPTAEEVGRFLVRRALKASGLARLKDIQAFLQPAGGRDLDWQAAGSRVTATALSELVEVGEVVRVNVEGDETGSWYALAATIRDGTVATAQPAPVRFLSPFDNLVIRRDWLKKLFDFDYTLECYLPEKKRQYGYFVFPILWHDRLVGRLDPKADRRTKTFIIRNLVLEPGFEAGDEFRDQLKEALTAFARFNGCRKYVIKGRVRGLQEPRAQRFPAE